MSTSIAPTPRPHRLLGRPFYAIMAVLIAACVAYGFSRTVDAGLIHPRFVVPRILYVHVALFVGWILLLLTQTTLVVTRNVRLHRRVGLASVGLGVALPVVGVWVSIIMARIGAGQGDKGAGTFLIIPFADMVFFSVLFAFAVLRRRDIEAHRRLMLMAAIVLTSAAFGRFPSWIVPNGGWYYAASDLLIGMGVARDLIVQRRVHPVYRLALPLLILGQLAALGFRHTDTWNAASQFFIR